MSDEQEDAFAQAILRSGQQDVPVMAELAKAYVRYVWQHGKGPAFPVRIVPFEVPSALDESDD